MSNFKAGDKAVLVSVEPHWKVKVTVGTEVTVKGRFVGGAGPGYWVEVSTRPGSSIYYAEHRLGPIDDPLPPAPESVLYVNKAQWGIQLVNTGDYILIGSGCPESVNRGWTLASMDADTALQMCHDLRRMAMDIKRKENQNG